MSYLSTCILASFRIVEQLSPAMNSGVSQKLLASTLTPTCARLSTMISNQSAAVNQKCFKDSGKFSLNSVFSSKSSPKLQLNKNSCNLFRLIEYSICKCCKYSNIMIGIYALSIKNKPER